jgi:hypothetical protein
LEKNINLILCSLCASYKTGTYLWVRLPVGPSPCGSDSLWVPVPQGLNSDLAGMGPTGNRTYRESDPQGLGPTGIANLRSDLAGLGHTGTRTHRVYPDWVQPKCPIYTKRGYYSVLFTNTRKENCVRWCQLIDCCQVKASC